MSGKHPTSKSSTEQNISPPPYQNSLIQNAYLSRPPANKASTKQTTPGFGKTIKRSKASNMTMSLLNAVQSSEAKILELEGKKAILLQELDSRQSIINNLWDLAHCQKLVIDELDEANKALNIEVHRLKNLLYSKKDNQLEVNKHQEDKESETVEVLANKFFAFFQKPPSSQIEVELEKLKKRKIA